jgi:coenzyme F420-reducing hydrogenase gamma subunit
MKQKFRRARDVSATFMSFGSCAAPGGRKKLAHSSGQTVRRANEFWPEVRDRSLNRFSQQCFESAEELLDRIEIGEYEDPRLPCYVDCR